MNKKRRPPTVNSAIAKYVISQVLFILNEYQNMAARIHTVVVEIRMRPGFSRLSAIVLSKPKPIRLANQAKSITQSLQTKMLKQADIKQKNKPARTRIVDVFFKSAMGIE